MVIPSELLCDTVERPSGSMRSRKNIALSAHRFDS